MRLAIYVNYSGTCEEAFRFYAEHLGGRITGIVRHSEMGSSGLPPEWTETDAERVYGILTEGGEVFMPMERTPFANRFAMLRDRFGTSWMLLHQPESA